MARNFETQSGKMPGADNDGEPLVKFLSKESVELLHKCTIGAGIPEKVIDAIEYNHALTRRFNSIATGDKSITGSVTLNSVDCEYVTKHLGECEQVIWISLGIGNAPVISMEVKKKGREYPCVHYSMVISDDSFFGTRSVVMEKEGMPTDFSRISGAC